MEDERDLITLTDDDGNELTMEVIDYFFYEGDEYAILKLAQEACEGCTKDACEGCASDTPSYVMKVVPADDDMEEFEPVDEALEQKLIELIESGAYDDEDGLDEEEE